MLAHLIIFIIGLGILYMGGELFIRGSSNTARLYGIKPLVVGVIIVAFATSSPEFFVSVLATIKRNEDLAIGNIIGSCICNIGMALGLAALVKPIDVRVSLLKREVPVLFAITLVFFVFCLDFVITRKEAVLMLLAFSCFLAYSIKSAKEEDDGRLRIEIGSASKKRSLAYLAIGITGLIAGSYIMVNSATNLAQMFGISELIIGLSVVAIGTSLPEITTSVVASLRNEGDISVGNVIGSNIFNILLIVGVMGLIRPIALDISVVRFMLPVLLIYTFILLPVLRSGFKISRQEGAFLLTGYILYLYLLYKR